jgi:hypothetical protein
MRPLAEILTSLETGAVVWNAASPGDLAPQLAPSDDSTIGPDAVLAAFVEHLAAPSLEQ